MSELMKRRDGERMQREKRGEERGSMRVRKEGKEVEEAMPEGNKYTAGVTAGVERDRAWWSVWSCFQFFFFFLSLCVLRFSKEDVCSIRPTLAGRGPLPVPMVWSTATMTRNQTRGCPQHSEKGGQQPGPSSPSAQTGQKKKRPKLVATQHTGRT